MTAEPISGATQPGDLVAASVNRVLGLAATWLAWDGQPRVAEDGGRIYTPHKAIRRHADHLIDHFAHIESLLAGEQPAADRWHASLVTLASDWAMFTEADLNEAHQRLSRLGAMYRLRLSALDPAEWDLSRQPDWTVRQIAEHVASTWYADQIGDLTATRQSRHLGGQASDDAVEAQYMGQ